MVSMTVLAAIALPLYWAFTTYTALRRNIAAAKLSGLPYVVAPVYMYNRFWLTTAALWLPLIKKLPQQWTKDWPDLLTPDWMWKLLYDPFERHGDTFLVVSPGRTCVWTASAEAIHHISSHRDSFPKPLESYKALDLYGRNVVTTEGLDWRMHRKAAAPGFNEKNSALVFKESISQTLGMLKKWTGPTGEGNFTLKEIPLDTMRVTLHIISRVGFGVRLLWPGEELAQEDKQSSANYGSNEMPEGFSMSFENALGTLLDKIIWVLVFPTWILRYIPMTGAAEALKAFDNWGQYMKALYDQKVAETQSGEQGEGMDIMGSLVKGQIPDTENSPQSTAAKGQVRVPGLTESDIIGNSFVMLLAGHETTANTIHFALVELAANPSSQRRLQKDVDSIFAKTSPTEWDYDRDINKCLGGMIGAVLNEQLRLIPPVIGIPKSVSPAHDQALTLEGRKVVLPKGAFITLSACSVQRNPKYWPTRPSRISGAPNDLDDFFPERWLVKDGNQAEVDEVSSEEEDFGDFPGPDSATQLFRPVRGSYVPFSDGPRSCLGRRIAQVEVVAILAVIFQTYSIELAVDDWASDAEVDKMTVKERRVVYQKAQIKARATMRTATTLITLKLQGDGAHIPLRLVRKGDERFVNVMS